MCKPTDAPPGRGISLLLTHASFGSSDSDLASAPDKDDANKRVVPASPYALGSSPSKTSTLITVAFYVAFLFTTEYATNLFLAQFGHIDDALADNTSRAILARHLGVDFLCCIMVAYLGISNASDCGPLLRQLASPMAPKWSILVDEADGGHNERVFGYKPSGQRVMMVFFAYQVKNLYDCLYWNDGLLFIAHHVFAGGAAWAGMYPGCCHYYSLFYMGISELSTAILCVLANFDDEQGVVGLGDKMPLTKTLIGGAFVISFFVCRVYMWPLVTYYFSKDVLRAIEGNDPRAEGRRFPIKMVFYSCMGLSVIQVFFLAELFRIGMVEYDNIMTSLGLK